VLNAVGCQLGALLGKGKIYTQKTAAIVIGKRRRVCAVVGGGAAGGCGEGSPGKQEQSEFAEIAPCLRASHSIVARLAAAQDHRSLVGGAQIRRTD